MNMKRLSRWVAPSLVIVLILSAIACQKDGTKTATFNMPECPHDWIMAASGVTRSPILQTFALPKTLTNVPEFHDCQRLVVSDGPTAPTRYGALAAVFVRMNLDRIYLSGGDSGLGNGKSVQTLTGGLAVAEVLADSTYAPLHISVGFNCVVLRQTPTAQGTTPAFSAWMVPVADDSMCETDSFSKALTDATLLAVSYVPIASEAHLKDGDIPPVARWDWDAQARQQYIGIKCPSGGWCEIHAPGTLSPSTRYEKSAFSAFGLPQGPRVLRIKGWYDEQVLADFDDKGHPIPGGVRGTVFPQPDLAQRSMADYKATPWTPVAFVALDAASATYKTKYNYDPAPAPGDRGLNTVSLCRGDWAAKCGLSLGKLSAPMANPLTGPPCTASQDDPDTSTWYARVTSVGGTNKYFCVRYRGTGIQATGVVRWRWRANDDTIWISCPNGCCELDG